jgi:hypothetical protein
MSMQDEASTTASIDEIVDSLMGQGFDEIDSFNDGVSESRVFVKGDVEVTVSKLNIADMASDLPGIVDENAYIDDTYGEF